MIRGRGRDAVERAGQEVAGRFVVSQQVQQLQDFLNGRQPGSDVAARRREPRRLPVSAAVPVSIPITVAGGGRFDTLSRSRAVEQQINRPTVLVAKSRIHKGPKAWPSIWMWLAHINIRSPAVIPQRTGHGPEAREMR